MFIHDLGFPFASFGDAQRLGLKQGVHLLSVTRERIHQSLFSEFETPTEKMHCVRNIISADGTPIMIDTSYLPPSFSNSVGDLGGKLASDALRDHGEHFHTARILVAANPASDEAQKAFAIPNGYPTLRRIYQLTTSNSSLSIFGISESPFDCLACLVELEVSK
ncbi:UTRA domain-containing protein [Mesorhizobium sp. C268A]